MRKLIVLAAVAALFLVALPVGSAGADSPFERVSLEVETKLDSDGPPNGSFTASGPAEEAGLICDSGWSYDGPGKFSPSLGNDTAAALNIHALKVFVCEAESLAEALAAEEEGDVFVMRLQIHFDKKGGFVNWVIVGGWGAYAGIAGNGDGTSVGTLVEGVTDTLSGKIR
jgi:hypothetical protein